MKHLSVSLIFAFCVAGSIYCYVHDIGDGSTYLGLAALLVLLFGGDR